ncbi:MAG: F0F1 ATP synthase subunit alpha [Verrucomicrobia bacterium]|nr:F0F1 ATP synthase subunit alpha [Verrucomicrobiota bacterium]MDA1087773.1 F0F1 ATP synthase subunit alpha [Verrucomicrobiota bacterium]
MAMKINMLQMKEHGQVVEIKNDIVTIRGLSNCMNGQIVRCGEASVGTIVGFDQAHALALIVDDQGGVKPGDGVTATIDAFTVPVGEEFIGRHVNALGMPRDGKGPIKETMRYPIFNTAASVLERVPVKEVLKTGTKVVDMMIPIGKGQRELIIGDRMTGKTTIATDAMLNQRGEGVICIYCLIGKAEASLNRVLDIFDRENMWEYCIVVSAGAADSMGQQYLAPYVAASIGEYFMYELGGDVLCVFDDFTKHAWNYRQMSLLLERSPGRDAYPGDIFYIHSQLVERAGKLNPQHGSGSLSQFPIVETIQGDVTGYVPSNTISMTDGQIFTSTTLFGEGHKPAVDTGLSVSRIGNKVQWPIVKKLSGMLRLEYVQFKELEKLTRIKAGVSQEVERRLNRGRVVAEVLKQDADAPVSMVDQVIWLHALQEGYLDGATPANVSRRVNGFLERLHQTAPDILEEITEKRDIDDDCKRRLNAEFEKHWDTNI